MSFGSPNWLFALLLLPLAVAARVALRSRAQRYAVRFSAFSTLRAAAEADPLWRRELPAALVLATLAALVVAAARPHVMTSVPVRRAAVMLVTDHSGSMVASDVQPTRLGAAQAAARTFINQLPSAARVGVVTFSTGVDGVQPPTGSHQQAQSLIDGQSAGGGTDTGDALQLAINLLRQNAPRSPSAIVLLSDGAWNTGLDPVAVASQSGQARIPIYTVALGTAGATIPNPDGFGPPVPVAPDPGSLAQVAAASRGRSFTAADEGTLNTIYKRLGSQLGSVRRSREITSLFAVAGLVLLLGAATLASRTAARLP